MRNLKHSNKQKKSMKIRINYKNNMKVATTFIMAAVLPIGFAACNSDNDIIEDANPQTLGHPMLGDDMTKQEFMYNCTLVNNH